MSEGRMLVLYTMLVYYYDVAEYVFISVDKTKIGGKV